MSISIKVGILSGQPSCQRQTWADLLWAQLTHTLIGSCSFDISCLQGLHKFTSEGPITFSKINKELSQGPNIKCNLCLAFHCIVPKILTEKACSNSSLVIQLLSGNVCLLTGLLLVALAPGQLYEDAISLKATLLWLKTWRIGLGILLPRALVSLQAHTHFQWKKIDFCV